MKKNNLIEEIQFEWGAIVRTRGYWNWKRIFHKGWYIDNWIRIKNFIPYYFKRILK